MSSIEGIRITSSNLIGTTSNPTTFSATTGGTIVQLSAQTIPFNYYSTFPYGTYTLNIVEYGGAPYNLFVPEPPPAQSAYTTTVNSVFSGSVLSSFWGSYTTGFIQNLGFAPEDIVFAEGICSDDVDAPVFQGINNIGQFPTSTNSLLGPFMSGGLAGFPFVGQVGLGAWASHITTGTTASGGTLFITSTPHIGITYNGDVGEIFRRGNVNGTTPSSTCGAVAGAISIVIASGATEPQYSGWTGGGDYEFYYLQTILWPERATLSAMTYGNAMKYATETIRDSAKSFLLQNLPAAITGGTAVALGVPSENPVFFCDGLFINTDDGYESYVQVNGFSSYTYNNTTSAGTWIDMTTNYLTGLLS